jgi:gliding motility associated protien GldN
MLMLKFLFFSSFLALCSLTLSAQRSAESDRSANPNSLRPIRNADIMFKKSLWFRMDLREKINQPYFIPQAEFAKLFIDGVKEGLILPFQNDSLTGRMSKEEFLERLLIPQQEEDVLAAEFNNEDSWGKKKVAVAKQGDEFLPKQLYIIELREDLIFDKIRSRMVHDIQAIKIIIPGEQTPTGIDRELGSFSYKEFVEKLCKPIDPNTGKKTDNPRATWYNTQNSAAHMNLADAFELRLFSAGLVKYENPKNSMIVDVYGVGKKGLMAADQALMKLIEYEALLWSY